MSFTCMLLQIYVFSCSHFPNQTGNNFGWIWIRPHPKFPSIPFTRIMLSLLQLGTWGLRLQKTSRSLVVSMFFFSFFYLDSLDVMMSHKRNIMAKKTATSEKENSSPPEAWDQSIDKITPSMAESHGMDARIKGAERSVLWWFDASTWA